MAEAAAKAQGQAAGQGKRKSGRGSDTIPLGATGAVCCALADEPATAHSAAAATDGMILDLRLALLRIRLLPDVMDARCQLGGARTTHRNPT